MTQSPGSKRGSGLPGRAPPRPPAPRGRRARAGNPRVAAARALGRVLGDRQSLSATLPDALAQVAARDQGLVQELCFGSLRWYPQLQFLLERLLDHPLNPRERDIRALLLLSLYQLLHLRIPDYATVSEAVAAARALGRPWAAGLANAVLRNFAFHRAGLLAELQRDETLRSAHPAWLLHRLQVDWPQDWADIVAANNARPPLSLRVNLARLSRQDYLERLATAGLEALAAPYARAAITLTTPCDVEHLPGFRDGLVSIQDPAAQLAVELLDLQPELKVLDACAAPGGKTCHILESQPRLDRLLAVDLDAERSARIRENLHRLHLEAQLATGDVLTPSRWWDGVPYDRILLDAPCSATGVIRRHPDIKVLREAADIDRLAERQYSILTCLWPLLAPGGMLVYATCSVLKQENEDVVGHFLAARPDVRERPITGAWGRVRPHGRQILPGQAGMDGFFYARLVKHRSQ